MLRSQVSGLGLLVSLVVCCVLSTLFGCDQLNKPMAVPSSGSSSSASGAPATDAGTDAELPPLPGEPPRVTPQPGDTQL